MTKVIHKIGDTVIEPPVNNPGMEVELNFDADDPDAVQISVSNDWDFEKQASYIINAHITKGLNGGVGVFEGLPYTIQVQDSNSTETILDHYIDTADPEALYECDRISITSREKGGVDWLNNRAGNIMYKTLIEDENSGISTDDYVHIPYVISSIPNYKETAISMLTAFVVVSSIRDMVKEIEKVVAEIGTIISAIGGILKLVFIILWIIATLIAIVKLIKDITDSLVGSIKYHAGMRWKTLLEAGARAVGMEFKSTIFEDPIYRDTIIIPAKLETLEDIDKPEKRGFTKPSTKSNGYFDGSFRDLLAISKDIINGKIVCVDNEIRLERRDTNTSKANYKLPDIELRQHRTNAGELVSNYTIQLRDDISDENTIDKYSGTISTVITEPKVIRNPDAVLMRGEKTVDIPFARVVKKEGLTPVENILDSIYTSHPKIVNNIITTVNVILFIRNLMIISIKAVLNKLKIIGINIRFNPKKIDYIRFVSAGTMKQRIGIMSLSADYFQVPKIGSFDIAVNSTKETSTTGSPFDVFGILDPFKVQKTSVQTKTKSTNDTDWSADNIYSKFHFINSFVPQSGNELGNQWLRYETEVPFCKEDFLKVKNNNLIFDKDNRVGKIESLTWNPFNERAKISFRIQETYTKNLEEKIITPNGF
ncbi:MAG: hypothetical protein CMI54_06215 [Parcubacteria group bacterium]|jgi:hypothetical protein|nr:hypothetical protein [Parcubacteria group bacterium]|tara:strand:+ start:2603 stop:4558 length:1956 start_codon:yes stop_codon:yes gene_type:complete